MLRLYLHVPSLRATIRQELRQRELEDFGLPHHRKLWAHLSVFEDNLGLGLLEGISRGVELVISWLILICPACYRPALD